MVDSSVGVQVGGCSWRKKCLLWKFFFFLGGGEGEVFDV